MLTLSDFKILEAILDKSDSEKGIIATKGTTKKEIIDKTGLSITKINISLYSFIKDGLVEQGLKVKNSNTYCLTKTGMEEFIKLKGGNIND